MADEAERRRHFDAVVAIAGPLSTKTLNGFPGFKVSLLADHARREALLPVLREFVATAQA